MIKLILGSRSPRRKEILEYFSFPFIQVSSSFDENSIPFIENPADHVIAISNGKAEDLIKKFPDSLILTADTIVYCEGKVYGIPKDREEAYRTLRAIEGRWHEVYTGLTLDHHHEVEMTKVFINPLSDKQILSYLDSHIWSDKAGGYAIQGIGGLIVKKIEGCYYNVMGLPINAVHKLLKKHEIDLWNYIKS